MAPMKFCLDSILSLEGYLLNTSVIGRNSSNQKLPYFKMSYQGHKIHAFLSLPHFIGVVDKDTVYRYFDKRIEKMSISTKTWELFDEQETPLRSPYYSTLLYKKEILFYQGSFISEIYSYDLEKKLWKVLKFKNLDKIPENGFPACSISLYKDSLYVFGGVGERSSEIVKYDLEKNTMEYVDSEGNPPEIRSGHSSWVKKDKLYIFGGTNEFNVFLNDLHSFDFEYSQWKEIQTLGRWPYERSFASVTLDQENLYLFGGLRGLTPESDLWELDFTSFQWRRLFVPPEINKRFGHVSLVKGNKLLNIGGIGIDKRAMNETETIVLNQIHPHLLNCLNQNYFDDCIVITKDNSANKRPFQEVLDNVQTELPKFLESIQKTDDEYQKIVDLSEFLEKSFIFQHWKHTFSK